MNRETIGKFIDASVNDHAEAKRLLNTNPELRNANWKGDEGVLCFLAIENFPKGVGFCIENGFDPNQTDGNFNTTALHYACKLNYAEIATVLLQNGADPNIKSEIDDTPLHCCVQTGNAEIMDLLISNGADAGYTTDLGETIFDNWPNDAEKQAEIAKVLEQHNIEHPAR